MSEKIKFIDIAKLAQVSVGTLSRYFNNGSISEKKRKRISKIIEEKGYIINAMASNIKRGTNETIVIRTFGHSMSQDRIIEGILVELGNNLIVRYSENTTQGVIEQVKKALTYRPSKLVVFAPVDAGSIFAKYIKIVEKLCSVVVYNYKISNSKCVLISVEDAFKDLAKTYKGNIKFIYSDKNDHASYLERVKQIKKTFKDLGEYKYNNSFFANKNYLCVFQFEKTFYEYINRTNDINVHGIYFSYMDLERLVKNKYWIFIDYVFVGIMLGKLLKNQVFSTNVIQGKLISRF